MRPRGSWLWIVLLPAACIAYQWTVHALLVEAGTPSAQTMLAVLNGLPHAAINLLLLWVFGRTLARGHEPLVTGFARRIKGNLPSHIPPYTRSVTVAWCAFFAAQVLLSAILLAAAPLAVWSLFVNVLSFPLVIVMFVAEYLYRLARFPDDERVPIWKGVEAYVSHARDARAQPPSRHS